MFIEIEDLEPEPLHVHHIFPAGEIKFSHEDAVLNDPVTVDFSLDHKDRSLHIEGMVATAILFRCSRCTKESKKDLSAGFDLSYLPQPVWSDKNAEVELKYDDMEVASYDGIAFNVNMMVLEQIELAIPMKLICREECKGLCYKCGADLNEGTCPCSSEKDDARLSVLLDFRNKNG